jgi:hypothetical protein
VTTRERLHRLVDRLTDGEAARARVVVDDTLVESEMAPLPEGWGETLTGEPMPDVVDAVRRSRESH